MIEEAVSHTPLEAMFAKELDKMSEKIMQMEKRLPQTLAQKMEAIASLPYGAKQFTWSEKDI